MRKSKKALVFHSNKNKKGNINSFPNHHKKLWTVSKWFSGLDQSGGQILPHPQILLQKNVGKRSFETSIPVFCEMKMLRGIRKNDYKYLSFQRSSIIKHQTLKLQCNEAEKFAFFTGFQNKGIS